METLEFFYWLGRLGYDGYYILDIFPYREDGAKALQQGVNRVQYFIDAAQRLNACGLDECFARHDHIAASTAVWKKILADVR